MTSTSSMVTATPSVEHLVDVAYLTALGSVMESALADIRSYATRPQPAPLERQTLAVRIDAVVQLGANLARLRSPAPVAAAPTPPMPTPPAPAPALVAEEAKTKPRAGDSKDGEQSAPPPAKRHKNNRKAGPQQTEEQVVQLIVQTTGEGGAYLSEKEWSEA